MMKQKLLIYNTVLLNSIPAIAGEKADFASATGLTGVVSVVPEDAAEMTNVTVPAGTAGVVSVVSGDVRVVSGNNIPANAAAAGSAENRKQVTYFGVAPEPVSDELRDQLPLKRGEGILVGAVIADSPAAKADIRLHDILLRFDDQILVVPDQLKTLVQMRNPGEKVKITLMRKGAHQAVEVTLAQTSEGGNEDCVPGVHFQNDGMEKLLRGLKNIPGAVVVRKATVIGPDGTVQTFGDKDMGKAVNLIRKNIGQDLPKDQVDNLLKSLGEINKDTNKSGSSAP